MNRRKILQLIVAASAISSGIALSQGNVVNAATNKVDFIFNSPTTVIKQQGKVVNVSSTLRLRSAASSSASIVGYIQNGSIVNIIGESGDWYQINYNSNICYVSKSYVSAVSQTSTSSSSTGTVVNISSNLRVRSAADINSTVLGYLGNGTKVTVTGEIGSWYRIQYNNGIGYVSKEYISLTSSAVPVTTQTSSTSTSETSGKVVNVTTNLRVRSAASTTSSVLGYLNNGTNVIVTGTSGDWYSIKYNNGTGYVSKEYVSLNDQPSTTATSTPTNTATSTPVNTSTSTPTATTTPTNSIQKGKVINVSSNLRVRSAANSSSAVLGYLLNDTVVTIKGSSGDWYAIGYNGNTGYVSKVYIKIVDSSTVDTTNQTSKYAVVINSMKAQLGSPYVWGGSGEYLSKALLDTLSQKYPSQAANGSYTRAYSYVGSGLRAFDCSGLMQWGYAQAGITIGRSTWDQVEDGTAVSLNDLQPGDLLFYKTLTHVGMYIGDGQWIEAPNKTANVRITAVPWNNIGQARRIIN